MPEEADALHVWLDGLPDAEAKVDDLVSYAPGVVLLGGKWSANFQQQRVVLQLTEDPACQYVWATRNEDRLLLERLRRR